VGLGQPEAEQETLIKEFYELEIDMVWSKLMQTSLLQKSTGPISSPCVEFSVNFSVDNSPGSLSFLQLTQPALRPTALKDLSRKKELGRLII
jgi:hypothetical protein